MLKKLLGSLLGKGKPAAATAPAMTAAAVATPTTQAAPLSQVQALGFVAHQPLQDRSQRVVAYEFVVKGNQGQAKSRAHQHSFDRLLLTTLRNMNVFRLLAYRRAFIHVSLASLPDLPAQELPLDSCIFVLEARDGDVLDDALLAQLDTLREAGWRFAAEPARFGSLSGALALYQRMDYLVLDFAAPNARALFPLLEKLPQRFSHLRWLARNINSAEELALCQQSPGSQHFALFHGSYLGVAQPASHHRKEAPNQGRVLEIMRLLRAEATPASIEAQFKLDSLLLFKLLRYVNSPVNGLARKVQTIEESIMLLGRDNLFKWLSLLLFTAEGNNGASLTLMEKSLIRGRFMEQLGLVHGNRLEAEHLFLTGMFSMLGALLHTSQTEALAPLDLPVTIADALLNNRGLFARPLQLTLACENEDSEAIATLCQTLQLSPEQATALYLEAVVWTQEVLQQSEVQSSVEEV